MITSEKLEEWKQRQAAAVDTLSSGVERAACLEVLAREAVPALLGEVERLRGDSVVARDPNGEPDGWVEVYVRAKDHEQRTRAVMWLRTADDVLAALRDLVSAIDGCTGPLQRHTEDCPGCRRLPEVMFRARKAVHRI